jgi:hypothetical protein
MPRYKLRTLLILLAVAAIASAIFGGWYGYAAAYAIRPHGNAAAGAVASGLITGLTGLLVGVVVLTVVTHGFRFSIRDVLWLTVVVGLGVGWWIHAKKTEAIRKEHAVLQSSLNDLSQYIHDRDKVTVKRTDKGILIYEPSRPNDFRMRRPSGTLPSVAHSSDSP